MEKTNRYEVSNIKIGLLINIIGLQKRGNRAWVV